MACQPGKLPSRQPRSQPNVGNKRGHALDFDAIPMGDANEILIDPVTRAAWGTIDKREGGKATGIDWPKR